MTDFPSGHFTIVNQETGRVVRVRLGRTVDYSYHRLGAEYLLGRTDPPGLELGPADNSYATRWYYRHDDILERQPYFQIASAAVADLQNIGDYCGWMQDDASTADAERHRRRKRFASMLSDAPDDLAKNLAALIPQTWKDTAEKEYAAEPAKWEQEGEPLLRLLEALDSRQATLLETLCSQYADVADKDHRAVPAAVLRGDTHVRHLLRPRRRGLRGHRGPPPQRTPGGLPRHDGGRDGGTGRRTRVLHRGQRPLPHPSPRSGRSPRPRGRARPAAPAGSRLPTTAANEILTDTAAAYLGAGWLPLDAYREDSLTHQKPGHLTPEEFGYVLAKRGHLFGEDLPAWFTSPQAYEAYARPRPGRPGPAPGPRRRLRAAPSGCATRWTAGPGPPRGAGRRTASSGGDVPLPGVRAAAAASGRRTGAGCAARSWSAIPSGTRVTSGTSGRNSSINGRLQTRRSHVYPL